MLLAFILLFSLVFLAFFIGYFLWMGTLVFGGQDSETSNEAIKKIGEIIKIRGIENGLLYDLGSSTGGFIFKILGACPHLQAVGIDNSRIRTWVARLSNIFSKNKNSPKFITADIFKKDISRIDLAFVYLPRPLLPALQAKLQKELKPGALVITYRVNLPTWQANEVILTDLERQEKNNIFVYVKA